MHNSNTDIWLAGAIAAFTVDFVVYPLDTLKTRIQSPKYKEVYTDAATGAIKRQVLFRGLYQGIWSVVIATIPSSGAFFTTYEGVKHILNSAAAKNSNDPNTQNMLPFRHALPAPVINGIASSAAECVSCFILTPAEVLKQNAQMVTSTDNDSRGDSKTPSSSPSSSSSSSSSSRKPTAQVLSTFRAHPTQLWRGYGTLVARNLPFTAMQFPLFEYLRERVSSKWRQHQQQQPTSEQGKIMHRALITALTAGIAGGIAAIITTPIDVVKTRVMLAAGEANDISAASSSSAATTATSEKIQRTNTRALAVGREIYRKEGLKGLFRGGALRAVWTALGLGLYLSAYETGRMYFEKRREEHDGDGTRQKRNRKSEGNAII